jgi:hypothetical protein
MRKAILSLLLILSVSCNNKNNIDPENKNFIDMTGYFPLKIGNKWIYESKSIGEWAITQREIVDTLQNNNNVSKLYKTKWGIINYPPNSFSFEYYNWDSSGLFKYSCGIEDTCKNQSGNSLPPFKELIIKSKMIEGEKWNRGPEWLTNSNYFKYKLLDKYSITANAGSTRMDTTFFDVALITNSQNDTSGIFEYYAHNIGLISYYIVVSNDTTYSLNLVEYQIK